jgi:hypothetical protein
MLDTTTGEVVEVTLKHEGDDGRLPDGMRRPVSAGCDKLPMFDVLKAQ